MVRRNHLLLNVNKIDANQLQKEEDGYMVRVCDRMWWKLNWETNTEAVNEKEVTVASAVATG